MSDTNPTAKTPSPELDHLNAFVGRWIVEGINYPAAPGSGESPISGEEHYEWLPGNFYLTGRWNHIFDKGTHQGLSILGYDEAKGELFTKNFDNMGYEQRYPLQVSGNKWMYNGEAQRAIREFSADGNSFTENWEMKNEAGHWVPLCILNGVKNQ